MATITVPPNELKASITTYLHSKNLPPTPNWLSNFLPTLRPNTPLPALQKTALFRLLSTDLTTSVQATNTNVFPPNISAPETRERKLPGPIPVQVLDIEDLGHSRWSQVEALEAQERGETSKGREVIRVVEEDDGTNPDQSTTSTSTSSGGPHKLLVQDAEGTKAYAFEMEPVTGVGVGQMCIGAKLVLREVVVARGVVMLEGKGVEVLGGKVEGWERKWRGERKGTLKRMAGLGGGG